MRTIDWVVFALFLGYVVWDGVRRSSHAKDLEGYYAGSRRIPWWAAGLSIMATQASAITVIGTTGEGHEYGMQFLQTYFGLPFAMVLLCIYLIPLFRQHNILTPYEYLEQRFGPLTRALASAIFLGSRCLALGVVIYAPAVALSAMIGLETWQSVLAIGVLTTLYTVVGGVAAVIWTDVKQMTVILVGLLVILGLLLRDLLARHGLGTWLELAGAAGKMQALAIEPAQTGMLPRTLAEVTAGTGTPSFWEEKYNLWSGLFGGLFLHLSYFGCDHSQAQRLLTSKDIRQSRLSLLMSAFAKVPMQALVLFLGVLLWLFYSVHGQPLLYKSVHAERAAAPVIAEQMAVVEQKFAVALDTRRAQMELLAAAPGTPADHPQLLREYQQAVQQVAAIRKEARLLVSRTTSADGKRRDEPDTNDIFCRYILDHLPPVLLGLVIAAIFAAAMSSIDSTLNALSAATVVDFYRRWLRPGCSEAHAVAVGRFTTLLWGGLATAMALFFAGGGSVIEQINRIGSFFYGSLLGVFALALLVPRAGRFAGALGLLGGMASVLWVHNTWKVEFLWYNVVGCFGVLLVGGITAMLEPARRRLPATGSGR